MKRKIYYLPSMPLSIFLLFPLSACLPLCLCSIVKLIRFIWLRKWFRHASQSSLCINGKMKRTCFFNRLPVIFLRKQEGILSLRLMCQRYIANISDVCAGQLPRLYVGYVSQYGNPLSQQKDIFQGSDLLLFFFQSLGEWSILTTIKVIIGHCSNPTLAHLSALSLFQLLFNSTLRFLLRLSRNPPLLQLKHNFVSLIYKMSNPITPNHMANSIFHLHHHCYNSNLNAWPE